MLEESFDGTVLFETRQCDLFTSGPCSGRWLPDLTRTAMRSIRPRSLVDNKALAGFKDLHKLRAGRTSKCIDPELHLIHRWSYPYRYSDRYMMCSPGSMLPGIIPTLRFCKPWKPATEFLRLLMALAR